jgi:hypothetical protein
MASIIFLGLSLVLLSLIVVLILIIRKQAIADGLDWLSVLTLVLNPGYIGDTFKDGNFSLKSAWDSLIYKYDNGGLLSPATSSTPSSSTPSTPETLSKPFDFNYYLDRDAHLFAIKTYADTHNFAIDPKTGFLQFTEQSCNNSMSWSPSGGYETIFNYNWHPEVTIANSTGFSSTNKCVRSYDGIVQNSVCPEIEALPSSGIYAFDYVGCQLSCNMSGVCNPTGGLLIPTCSIEQSYCLNKGMSYESGSVGQGDCYSDEAETILSNLLGAQFVQQLLANPVEMFTLMGYALMGGVQITAESETVEGEGVLDEDLLEDLGMEEGESTEAGPGGMIIVVGEFLSYIGVNEFCNYVPEACAVPPPKNAVNQGLCCNPQSLEWNGIMTFNNLYDPTEIEDVNSGNNSGVNIYGNSGWLLNPNSQYYNDAIQQYNNFGTIAPLIQQAQESCLFGFFQYGQTGYLQGFDFWNYKLYEINMTMMSGASTGCDIYNGFPAISQLDFNYVAQPSCGWSASVDQGVEGIFSSVEKFSDTTISSNHDQRVNTRRIVEQGFQREGLGGANYYDPLSTVITDLNNMVAGVIDNNVAEYWYNTTLLNNEPYWHPDRVLNGFSAYSPGFCVNQAGTIETTQYISTQVSIIPAKSGWILATICDSSNIDPNTHLPGYTFAYLFNGGNNTFTTQWTVINCPSNQMFCNQSVSSIYSNPTNLTSLNSVVTSNTGNFYNNLVSDVEYWCSSIRSASPENNPLNNITVAFNNYASTGTGQNGNFILYYNLVMTISGIVGQTVDAVTSAVQYVLDPVMQSSLQYLIGNTTAVISSYWYYQVVNQDNITNVLQPPIVNLGLITYNTPISTNYVTGVQTPSTQVVLHPSKGVTYKSTWTILQYSDATDVAFYTVNSASIIDEILTTFITPQNANGLNFCAQSWGESALPGATCTANSVVTCDGSAVTIVLSVSYS